LHHHHGVLFELTLGSFVSAFELALYYFFVRLLSLFVVASDHKVRVDQRGISRNRLGFLLCEL